MNEMQNMVEREIERRLEERFRTMECREWGPAGGHHGGPDMSPAEEFWNKVTNGTDMNFDQFS
jgi:hypothetical protein